MRKTLLFAGFASAMVLGLAGVPATYAQEGTAGWAPTWRAGQMAPATPTCPAVQWHIQPVKTLPGSVNGVAFFSDMSGISIVTGTILADGTISSVATSVNGKGPAGTITGKRSPNVTHFEMHGEGCSNVSGNIYRHKLGAAAGGF